MTAIYVPILETARLEQLKLLTATSAVQPFYSFGEEGDTLQIRTRWENETFVAEQQSILGACEWVFECITEDSEEPPVAIRASYLLHYRQVGEDEAVASAYLRDVGRMASYPYFRSHVAMILNESSLVLPPLPVINTGTFRKVDRISAKFVRAASHSGASAEDSQNEVLKGSDSG